MEETATTTSATTQPQQDDEGSSWIVKFVPFSSSVESSFWVRYCQEKLETIRLNEDPIDLRAYYNVDATTTGKPRLQLQENSLRLGSSSSTTTTAISVANERVAASGTLIGFNTAEAFQKADKNKILHDALVPRFKTKNDDDCNRHAEAAAALNSFVLVTFADLKQHSVRYWFGIPALLTRKGKSIRAVGEQPLLKDVLSSEECDRLASELHSMRARELQRQQQNGSGTTSGGLPPFFVVRRNNNNNDATRCIPLSEYAEQTTIQATNKTGDAEDESSKNAATTAATSKNDDVVVFGFFDPVGPVVDCDDDSTTPEQPQRQEQQQPMGWPMRNLIAFLSVHLNLGGQLVTILSCRPSRLRRISTTNDDDDDGKKREAISSVGAVGRSILIKVRVPHKEDYQWDSDPSADDGDDGNGQQQQKEKEEASAYKTVGWEVNERGNKPGSRRVNLKPLLDEKHLAIQASDLNLKLMKWRMIPELRVDMLQSAKVLLIGAGTLGCNVARVLLAWGIRDFTIVDYGTVSYSNPVRQSLFTLDDCRDTENNKNGGGGSGRSKAVAAASALRAIAADVRSEGIVLSIPMPGHAEDDPDDIRRAVDRLDGLVQACDAVFLLTDTRESRWLPTVMAAAHDKLLINAALGLDSWLVMRHGCGIVPPSSPSTPVAASAGAARAAQEPRRYGCYFCNDIVAPENSTRNRTLDQQCTVTRPGLAPIASSMAAELCVALLHHPLSASAPAPVVTAAGGNKYSPASTQQDDDKDASTTNPLGAIPHQIRGSLVSYTMMTPAVPAFAHCTACSSPVVEAYRSDKTELVLGACRSSDGSYLEGISGLLDFRARAAEKMEDMDNFVVDDDDCDDCDDWD